MGKKNKPRVIDLHGYKESEVDDAIDRFLLKESQRGSSRVHIMTGKGKGIVQSRVISYLKQAGYHWDYEKSPTGAVNPGVLVVYMD